MFKILILCLLIFSIRAQDSSSFPGKKYNLSICAIFKNEKKYLKEWIEFHRRVGVDHIYLYNNNSTDRPLGVLKPYIQNGYITLIHWPDYLSDHEEENDFIWPLSTQISAYENAKMRGVHETNWLVFLEVDEFLIPVNTRKLTDVLQKYEDYPGVVLSKDFFDASQVETLPKRNLVIETVEMTAPEQNFYRSAEKAIFKPDLCEYFTWPPYKFIFKNHEAAVSIGKKEIRINRYIHRVKDHFQLPRRKSKIDVDMKYLSESEMQELLEQGYEIEDTEKSIFRFVPEVLRALGFDTGWNW